MFNDIININQIIITLILITLYQTAFLHLAIISGSRMAVLITLQGRFAKSLYKHQICIAGIEESLPKVTDTPNNNLHYKIVFTKALTIIATKLKTTVR